jgi:hypothetical protein
LFGGPGCFEEERSENHPPQTSGGDEKGGETGTGDGNGLVEEEVLQEGLRECECGEKLQGRGADFLTEVLSEEEETAASDGETDSGEEKDERKSSDEVLVIPNFVNGLDDREGASPKQGANEDRRKRAAEEEHGGVITGGESDGKKIRGSL